MVFSFHPIYRVELTIKKHFLFSNFQNDHIPAVAIFSLILYFKLPLPSCPSVLFFVFVFFSLSHCFQALTHAHDMHYTKKGIFRNFLENQSPYFLALLGDILHEFQFPTTALTNDCKLSHLNNRNCHSGKAAFSWACFLACCPNYGGCLHSPGIFPHLQGQHCSPFKSFFPFHLPSSLLLPLLLLTVHFSPLL